MQLIFLFQFWTLHYTSLENLTPDCTHLYWEAPLQSYPWWLPLYFCTTPTHTCDSTSTNPSTNLTKNKPSTNGPHTRVCGHKSVWTTVVSLLTTHSVVVIFRCLLVSSVETIWTRMMCTFPTFPWRTCTNGLLRWPSKTLPKHRNHHSYCLHCRCCHYCYHHLCCSCPHHHCSHVCHLRSSHHPHHYHYCH